MGRLYEATWGRAFSALYDRFEGPWRFCGDGCHCNRDTVATVEASPLDLERVDRDRLPKAPPIVRPLVRGSALAG